MSRRSVPSHPSLCKALAASLLLAALAGPAGAQQAGAIPCGSPYVVAPGDTLSRIADRAYGVSEQYPLIAEANREALGGDTSHLGVGMSLNIPCPAAGAGSTASGPSSAMQAAIAEQGTLSPDELDTLFGPVALFPDTLLTPVLVATTYPLDVVKAAKFVEENASLNSKERAAQTENQPWDPSVRQLAAGFPAVITRMSDNIDWTEQAGEAVVAQTDDVLASIQRLRSKAQKNGYLADNDAQKVSTQNDKIVIAPANPNVVYVPTYDSQRVYTQPAPVGQPIYQYGYNYDDGNDWGDALLTGGVLLGGAVLLDEIFDDDDDNWHRWGWDDDIDWDRGDITINRDRTINRGDITIDGDRINVDRDRNRISIGSNDRVQVNRDRIANIGNRPGNPTSAITGNHRPISNAASRQAAREKIQTRKATGVKPANLETARRKAAGRSQVSRPQAQARAAQARATRPAAAQQRARVSKPAAHRTPAARPRASAPRHSSAFQRHPGPRASVSSHRGRASMGGGRGGRGGGGRGGRR